MHVWLGFRVSEVKAVELNARGNVRNHERPIIYFSYNNNLLFMDFEYK